MKASRRMLLFVASIGLCVSFLVSCAQKGPAEVVGNDPIEGLNGITVLIDQSVFYTGSTDNAWIVKSKWERIPDGAVIVQVVSKDSVFKWKLATRDGGAMKPLFENRRTPNKPGGSDDLKSYFLKDPATPGEFVNIGSFDGDIWLWTPGSQVAQAMKQ